MIIVFKNHIVTRIIFVGHARLTMLDLREELKLPAAVLTITFHIRMHEENLPERTGHFRGYFLSSYVHRLLSGFQLSLCNCAFHCTHSLLVNIC